MYSKTGAAYFVIVKVAQKKMHFNARYKEVEGRSKSKLYEAGGVPVPGAKWVSPRASLWPHSSIDLSQLLDR